MKLIYLYAIDGPAPTGSNLPWNENEISANPFVGNGGLPTEGFYYLFENLVDRKIVDDALLFIESTRSPGYTKIGDLTAYVLPEVDKIRKFVDPGDIIFVRNGFRTWFLFLTEMHEKKHWMVFYRAASNRGPWPFWDVILEDCLEELSVDKYGRLHLPFVKPIIPYIFYLMGMNRPYDICIGASHIHDKKAQWKTIQVIEHMVNKRKIELRCVLPGRVTGGELTRKAMNNIDGLPIDVIGMVPRPVLATVLNQSKLLVHLGGAGQNDRGVLEAMRCGAKPVLANIEYHAPLTYKNQLISHVIKDKNSIENIADELYHLLLWWEESIPGKVSEYYDKEADVQSVVIPIFERLFSVMDSSKVADRQLLYNEYLGAKND